MNTEIQTFTFTTATLRTLTDENGDPWFVAKDVCNILGLNNVGQALTRLDDDEKSSITLNDGTPGTPNKAIVSESGLYSLILSSKLESAKAFKHWVTAEVLPTIRKTGGGILTMAKKTYLLIHTSCTYQSFAVFLYYQDPKEEPT